MSMTRITQVIKSHDDDLKRQRVEDKVRRSATINMDFAANEYVNYDGAVASFVKKPIADMLTTTRTSDAAVTTPLGIETVGVDVPRLDFDPDTGEARGLLCEEQRTNLALRSESLTSPPWAIGSGFSRVLVAGDHPHRALDATVCHFYPKVGVNGFNNNNNNQTIPSLGPAGTYTIYADYKAVGACTTVRWLHSGIENHQNIGSVLNLTGRGGVRGTPTFTPSDSFSEQEYLDCIPLGNGWYRAICVFTTATDNVPLRVRAFPCVGNSALIGDEDQSGLLGTQLQVEAGRDPSSYIPTGSSQVTRAMDVNRTPTVDKINQTEGTFFVDVELDDFNDLSNAIVHLRTGSAAELLTSNAILIWRHLGKVRCSVYLGGETQSVSSVQNTTKFNKIAVSYSQGRLALSLNGAPAVIREEFNGITPVSLLTLASFNLNYGGTRSRHINQFRYIPHALTDQELQELTKP